MALCLKIEISVYYHSLIFDLFSMPFCDFSLISLINIISFNLQIQQIGIFSVKMKSKI